MKHLITPTILISFYIWAQSRRDSRRLHAALRSVNPEEDSMVDVVFAARVALTGAEGFAGSQTVIRSIETLRQQWGRKRGLICGRDYGARHSGGASQSPGVMHSSTYREKFIGASSTRIYGTFLHELVLRFHRKKVLELGTSVGISGSYIASALAANGAGQLVTLEGSRACSDIAGEIFEDLSLGEWVTRIVGPFHETLPGCLEVHGPFDMVFIDGHHDGAATVAYFTQILPYTTKSGIIVIDDIRWNDGMHDAWNEIAQHKSLVGGLDFQQIGLVMVGDVPKSSDAATAHS